MRTSPALDAVAVGDQDLAHDAAVPVLDQLDLLAHHDLALRDHRAGQLRVHRPAAASAYQPDREHDRHRDPRADAERFLRAACSLLRGLGAHGLLSIFRRIRTWRGIFTFRAARFGLLVRPRAQSCSRSVEIAVQHDLEIVLGIAVEVAGDHGDLLGVGDDFVAIGDGADFVELRLVGAGEE